MRVDGRMHELVSAMNACAVFDGIPPSLRAATRSALRFRGALGIICLWFVKPMY